MPLKEVCCFICGVKEWSCGRKYKSISNVKCDIAVTPFCLAHVKAEAWTFAWMRTHIFISCLQQQYNDDYHYIYNSSKMFAISQIICFLCFAWRKIAKIPNLWAVNGWPMVFKFMFPFHTNTQKSIFFVFSIN